MIKFGSRTELSIPMWLDPKIQVKIGQPVRGAADIVALLGRPLQTETRAAGDEEFEPIVGRESPA
jgi:hypothetical protein